MESVHFPDCSSAQFLYIQCESPYPVKPALPLDVGKRDADSV